MQKPKLVEEHEAAGKRIVVGDHHIGPFFVGAGETLVQRFSAAGEFEGLCTVHPSGEFILTVNE